MSTRATVHVTGRGICRAVVWLALLSVVLHAAPVSATSSPVAGKWILQRAAPVRIRDRNPLRSVSALCAKDVWAVSDDPNGLGAVVDHWVGRTLRTYRLPKSNALSSVSALSDTSVFAVGYRITRGTDGVPHATSRLGLEWNGRTWSRMGLPAIPSWLDRVSIPRNPCASRRSP